MSSRRRTVSAGFVLSSEQASTTRSLPSLDVPSVLYLFWLFYILILLLEILFTAADAKMRSLTLTGKSNITGILNLFVTGDDPILDLAEHE